MNRDRKIEIMGIVNITDNSYIAQSRCLGNDGKADIGAAIERIGTMVTEGADIIDIGACSTGPGVPPVGEEVEWQRLEPVLKAIRDEFPGLRISIDTYWASVIEKTFDTIGSFMANDISAGTMDKEMLPTVGRLGLEYVAMHMRGDSMSMQSLTDYPASEIEGLSPVSYAVKRYFEDFARKAGEYGISEWILDPGFGFAKTLDQNWELMSEMDKVLVPGHKTLVGVSRKSMIYKWFGISPQEALPATQALHFAALERGADILRVHDVAEARRTVEIYRRLICSTY